VSVAYAIYEDNCRGSLEMTRRITADHVRLHSLQAKYLTSQT